MTQLRRIARSISNKVFYCELMTAVRQLTVSSYNYVYMSTTTTVHST